MQCNSNPARRTCVVSMQIAVRVGSNALTGPPSRCVPCQSRTQIAPGAPTLGGLILLQAADRTHPAAVPCTANRGMWLSKGSYPPIDCMKQVLDSTSESAQTRMPCMHARHSAVFSAHKLNDEFCRCKQYAPRTGGIGRRCLAAHQIQSAREPHNGSSLVNAKTVEAAGFC